jgi:hypothetical protein
MVLVLEPEMELASVLEQEREPVLEPVLGMVLEQEQELVPGRVLAGHTRQPDC